MGVQLEPTQNDDLGPGKMDIAQLLENLCVIDGRAVRVTRRQPSSGAHGMNGFAAPSRLYS